MHSGMHLLEKDYVFSPTVALGGWNNAVYCFAHRVHHNSYKSRYTNTTLEVLAEIDWNKIILRNAFHNESICAKTASFKEHKTQKRSLKRS